MRCVTLLSALALTCLCPLTARAQPVLYVTDPSTVKTVPAGGGQAVTYATGFNGPTGIARDAAGNLFVASYFDNTVSMVPAGGGTPVTYATGLNRPEALAVDATGNLFIANYNTHDVLKVPAGGGPPVTYATLSGHPFSLAVDAACHHCA